MSQRARYISFKKAFPESILTYSKWNELTHWVDSAKLIAVLDMSIFPDTLESLIWNNSPIKQIAFCSTQTNLKQLSLSNTQLKKIEMPKKMKGLEELYLENVPIIELELGGNKRTLRVLEITPTTPKNRIKLPMGLKSLTSLVMVSRNGPVSLPKEAPKLRYLEITTNVGDSAIRIPSAYTSLAHISVYGKFSGLLVPKTLTAMESLEVESESEDFILPEIPTLCELAIETKSKKPLAISESYGEHMTMLTVRAPNIKQLTVPIAMDRLEGIILETPNLVNISLPEGTTELRGIRIIAGDITINSELPYLSKLDIIGKSVKVIKANTVHRLRHLSIGRETSVRARFPKEMLELETVSVNPQRVRLKNTYTPRLNWHLKDTKSYEGCLPKKVK